MLDRHSKRTVTAKTSTIIEKLKEHREEHVKILEEARRRYNQVALELLQNRLESGAQEGRLINLHFGLQEPHSFLEEFDTAITMLELHADAGCETIELQSDDVRKFVMNQWDWADGFYHTAAIYSDTAAAKLR